MFRICRKKLLFVPSVVSINVYSCHFLFQMKKKTAKPTLQMMLRRTQAQHRDTPHTILNISDEEREYSTTDLSSGFHQLPVF